ncbi:hypothetical protein BM536_010040 [Streptomyces phaeoluteigriseus]|uniref:Uncharacterized protein n=1 Tax=Streptomyces phaeoluteigriseus TaxID=114686 RepID=A0A1V6MVN7_9ACTN|nr:hypothetical protein BM536_010040 [Streptomyces phaeoluteigriseus]
MGLSITTDAVSRAVTVTFRTVREASAPPRRRAHARQSVGCSGVVPVGRSGNHTKAGTQFGKPAQTSDGSVSTWTLTGLIRWTRRETA